MKLCHVCRNIPFDALPSMPRAEGGATRNVQGHDEVMVQFIYFSEHSSSMKDPEGYQFHDDVDALETSATTCPLCALVYQRVDRWRKQYNDSDDKERWRSHYPNLKNTNLRAQDYTIDHCPLPPVLKLGLTKRLNSSPGFLVIIRNPAVIIHKDTVGLYIVTAVSFSVDNAHPLASQITQRPMEMSSCSPNSLQVAASLLQRCCKVHAKYSAADASLPSLILDVGFAEDPIKLVKGSGKSARYAALSYCWGKSVAFTTTKQTLESRKAGFQLSSLPATMLDAVLLTRHLGLRYLWIDSLCICQDDTEEWIRESANMLDIYSRAYVVIVANQATDSAQGIFHDRPLEPSTIIDDVMLLDDGHEPQTDRHDGIHATLVDSLTEWRPDELTGSPLTKRGWALQERVVARRALVYGSDQLYLECHLSCGVVGENGSGRAPEESTYWRPPLIQEQQQEARAAEENKSTVIKTASSRYNDESHQEEDVVDESDSHERKLLRWWNRMAWDYGTRDLSRPSDKLPALSGLARLYHEAIIAGGKGEEQVYLAGIWSGDVIGGLAWQGLGMRPSRMYAQPGTPESRAPCTFHDTVPSWSWVSYGGPTAMGQTPRWEDVAEVVGWEVGLRHGETSPFGEVQVMENGVKGTWLKIRTPVAKLKERDEGVYPKSAEELENEEWLKSMGRIPPVKMWTTRKWNRGNNENNNEEDDEDEGEEGEEEGHVIDLDDDDLLESGGWKDMQLYAAVLGGYPTGSHFALVVTPHPKRNRFEFRVAEGGDGFEYRVVEGEEIGGSSEENIVRRVGWCFIEADKAHAMMADEKCWSTLTLV